MRICFGAQIGEVDIAVDYSGTLWTNRMHRNDVPPRNAVLDELGPDSTFHRLLYDEQQLVLVFPEGRKGTEKLFKDRYRLRRFGRGGFVEAAKKVCYR